MKTLTQAQIAKRTFDHCRAHENVADLSDKQVWVIGYMYAGWVTDHYGAVTDRKLLEVMPEGMLKSWNGSTLTVRCGLQVELDNINGRPYGLPKLHRRAHMNEQQQEVQRIMESIDAMSSNMNEQQQWYARRAIVAMIRIQADMEESEPTDESA